MFEDERICGIGEERAFTIEKSSHRALLLCQNRFEYELSRREVWELVVVCQSSTPGRPHLL